MKMEWIEPVGAYDHTIVYLNMKGKKNIFIWKIQYDQYVIIIMWRRKTLMDSISECRITRFLANIRSLLDDYGKTHAVNSRSSIRVDEDYWYMRGKYMCDKESDKGWPCSSVFNV